MTHIKCHYINTSFETEDGFSYPVPEERFFENCYCKRFEWNGEMLTVGKGLTVFKEPPADDPNCNFCYDRILYLEIDGHVFVDEEPDKVVDDHLWIDVGKQLPKKGDVCAAIVECERGGTTMMLFRFEAPDKWIDIYWAGEEPYDRCSAITRWMLLHEPPKEDAHE